MARELPDEGNPLKALFITLLLGLVTTGSACASASGYDPKRYSTKGDDRPDADVDTAPLPPAPKTKIPDPRGPIVPAK